MNTVLSYFYRWLLLIFITGIILQSYFFLSIAASAWWQPASTSFQRSAIASNLLSYGHLPKFWHQESITNDTIPETIRRAVIASEDDLFFNHSGIDWNAIRKAQKNNAKKKRIIGASTISQQLTKNFFLSSERSMPRKAQELLLTWMLELFLTKERILDIYLNQVEWGEGIYGIQAAARHYFNIDAKQLNHYQAAQLAVLLPNPRKYGKNLNSTYLQSRSRIIAARMKRVALPDNN